MLGEMRHHGLADSGIESRQQSGHRLNQGYCHPLKQESLCHLQANIAAADYNGATTRLDQAPQAVGIGQRTQREYRRRSLCHRHSR
jgi:hypothetical protein